MADAYLQESGVTDRYLLEDGSGVLLLEGTAAATVQTQFYPSNLNGIGSGGVFPGHRVE